MQSLTTRITRRRTLLATSRLSTFAGLRARVQRPNENPDQGRTDLAIEEIERGLEEARRWPIPADAAFGCLVMSGIVKLPDDKGRYLDEAARLGGRGRFIAQIADAQRRLSSNRGAVAIASSLGAGDLTPRELDILRLMRSELTLREISVQLYVSYITVKGYSTTVYQKLAVSSRA